MTSPHRPALADFLGLAGQAPCVPVYRQLTGDGLTPVSAFRKVERAAPAPPWVRAAGRPKALSVKGYRAGRGPGRRARNGPRFA